MSIAKSNIPLVLCSQLNAPFLWDTSITPKLNFSINDEMKDALTKLTIGSTWNVDDDYEDIIFALNASSENFIDNQIVLINEFGFRTCLKTTSI